MRLCEFQYAVTEEFGAYGAVLLRDLVLSSLGGRTAELAVLLDRIWDTGFVGPSGALAPSASIEEDDEDEDDDEREDDVDVDADCEDEHDLASQDEAEIRALLTATLAYRRIFPASLPACHGAVVLSPPPSPPGRKSAQVRAALRTALGSPAFESGADGRLEDPELGAALEDARDRVVDMLVDFEQACRRGGRAFD